MGRKPKLTPHQRAEAIKRRDRGEAVREIARLAQWVLPYTFRFGAGRSEYATLRGPNSRAVLTSRYQQLCLGIRPHMR